MLDRIRNVHRHQRPIQTFLPHSDFHDSARTLDRLRLGKQRIEVMQILRALNGTSGGWKHHPAVLMWKGHERLLGAYGVAICDEWIGRGYRDTCRARIIDLSGYDPRQSTDDIATPGWLGDPTAHAGWQSLLVRKDPAHYGPLFPGVPDDLPFSFPQPDSGD